MEIPGYEIEKELGSGGMATVYLAVQQNLHRQVALKVMTPGLAVDETYCKRFLKEGRIAAQLNHLNLLTVYDIGVHDNHYYMASEFLPGGTVRDRMAEGMTTEDIVHIISDVAQGLQYAHSKGFVHRDVKPGNLLFRANGDCVLGDFGIAKAVDSNTGATKLGTAIGTPHYMSPEQAKGEKVDHRTDLYSLGVVFYEMLTGKPPFDAEDPFSVALMQINDPLPQLPSEFQVYQQLIEKLMEKDREHRYAQADEFLDDLEATTGQVSPARQTTRRRIERAEAATGSSQADQPTQERAGRSIMPFAVGGTALLAVVVGVVMYMGTGTTDDNEEPEPSGPGGTLVQPGPGERPQDPPEEESPIDQWMNDAAALVEQGRLIAPPGDNALELYKSVLAEDPDNDAARLALRELSNRLEEAIAVEFAKGELQAAYDLAMASCVEFPDDSGIAYMIEQVREQGGNLLREPRAAGCPLATAADSGDTADPSAEPQQDTPSVASAAGLADLVRQADQYFDANVFSHPPGKNAMELYLRVLEIDPGNSHAEGRLGQIANLWANAAETNIKRGKLDLARKMIDRGLQARPDHPKLIELQQQMTEGP
ncbi:MAG: protein kinase [Xanthomonadales bacterium]|nr:protein kinase [Xanthomonadales bacterium]